MFEKLHGIEERFIKLEQLLSDPDVIKDQKVYQQYVKEHRRINKIIEVYKEYLKTLHELEDSNELLKDNDHAIKEMAKEEIKFLKVSKYDLEEVLKKLLIPKDPVDEKNVILEIRAGTGGEEAGLFANDLFRMYTRYAENKKWEVEILNSYLTDMGGLKEIIAIIKGKGVFNKFKYESGTHRVQRVPTTEAQGRIHTSAVTVAILPEAKDVELNLNQGDIKVEVFRATGPGGQSVNTTDSAVRLTHLPTGVVATCQDQKSQIKNKNKAMQVLKARILDAMIREENTKRSADRKGQIGSGDRSERIRTYNFPQGRVTDHRINLTLYKLDSIMQGNIEEVINELFNYNQTQALQNAESL